jgi:trans-aconitate methyltransferase
MTEQPNSREAKKAATIETYNRSADALAGKFDALGARVDDINETFKLIDKENPKVLEIGFGNGRDAQEILKKTNDYTGIDISTELTKLAQQKSPTGKFEVADVNSFEFPKQIDIVFAFASLIHLDRDELHRTLQKLFDNLAAGGVARISMKFSDQYQELTKADEFGTRTYYHYSNTEMAELAEGFSVVKNEVITRGDQKWLEVILQKPAK